MNSLTNRFKKLKNRKGFTLVELIVVIVIIGILAAILIPRLTGFTDKANQTQAVVWAKEVATAIDSYYAENSAWPTSEGAIQTLSGVDAGSFEFVGTTGGCRATYTKGTSSWTAGRATGADKVVAGY